MVNEGAPQIIFEVNLQLEVIRLVLVQSSQVVDTAPSQTSQPCAVPRLLLLRPKRSISERHRSVDLKSLDHGSKLMVCYFKPNINVGTKRKDAKIQWLGRS